MNKLKNLIAMSSVMMGGAVGAVEQGGTVPAFLRCEYERNPVGVATDKPMLMWEVRATNPKSRGLEQKAYRVLVASSSEKLAKDEGNLWDSGKVASADTLNVAYAGKPLASLQRVYWKVKLWDPDGKESPWSEPADWIMALKPEEWKAQWITRDWSKPYPGDTAPLAKGLPYHEQLLPAPLFRKSFVVSKPMRRAVLTATAAGCCEAHINGKRPGDLTNGQPNRISQSCRVHLPQPGQRLLLCTSQKVRQANQMQSQNPPPAHRQTPPALPARAFAVPIPAACALAKAARGGSRSLLAVQQRAGARGESFQRRSVDDCDHEPVFAQN